MSCPHTDDTLLWLYGEGDEAHAEHVASCATCRRLVQEHEEVASALGPTLGAVAPAGAGAAPDPGVRPEPASRPRRRWGGVGVSGLALAAAALIAVWIGSAPQLPVAEPAPDAPVGLAGGIDTAMARAPVVVPSDDRLDVQLDTLELELDALDLELETL